MVNANILAVILARGGSKRLPGKNIKPFHGKTLLARTITSAISSHCFVNVIVSTDNLAIKTEAEKNGANVPFLRPKNLATDTASSVQALIHAVKFMIKQTPKIVYTDICLLQTTSPFLTENHIKDAIKQYYAHNFTSLSSMTKAKIPPEWMFQLNASNLKAIPDYPNKISAPINELSERYYENGALYLIKTDYLLQKNSLYDTNNHSAFIMTADDSVDIDTQNDWDYATYLLNKKFEN